MRLLPMTLGDDRRDQHGRGSVRLSRLHSAIEERAMEVKNPPEQSAAGYNGLTEQRQALPAHYYFDRAHYERELRRIWFRNWIYVGRSEVLPGPRSFRTFEIAD